MKLVQYKRPQVQDWPAFEPFTALNRLFNAAGLGLTPNAVPSAGWTPAIEVAETDDNFVVKVELPGINKDDINISFDDGVLTISGERKSEHEVKEGGTVRSERFFGRFQRSVTLPRPVSVEKTKASYKDGILSVTLPKTEEAKPRQIAVNVQ